MKTAPMTQLQVFLAVARHRSFSAAARELGVSASAVSQSVRQLEEQLRVTLLTRTTRSVAPTEAGRRLVEGAGPAMGQALAALTSTSVALRWRSGSRIIRITMFTSERLLIRAWKESDAEAFYELTLDEGFNLYPINVYRQESIDTAREWIRNVKGKLAVFEKESSQLIGMGGLTPWTWEGEELFDITYRLRESAWGKGYGWELAEALVNS